MRVLMATAYERYMVRSDFGAFLGRLNEQHEIIKQVFNGVLIHPAIYLKEDSAILDAATGTGE